MERPPEVLSHGQVTLRRWRSADAEIVWRLVSESLEHLRPWMPWAARYDAGSAAEFTRQCEKDWASGAAFNYAITTGGQAVGGCGLMARVGSGALEIGYWVHRDHTCRGLASDAAAALSAAAFTLPGVDRVEILHDEANIASAGVPRKLGFTEVEKRPSAADQSAPGETGISVVWRLVR